MRLWTIHPQHLDSKGLVALWRETLLAQNVLAGNTKGYKNHPQLLRFKTCKNPLGAIAEYLRGIKKEADQRNYHFDSSKINSKKYRGTIPVNKGQIEYEKIHLLKKLKTRDLAQYKIFKIAETEIHPLFKAIDGDIEPWEILST